MLGRKFFSLFCCGVVVNLVFGFIFCGVGLGLEDWFIDGMEVVGVFEILVMLVGLFVLFL